jgi:exodeoxyribonuclease-1
MAAPESFFFYDLETSGLSPQRHRIMQFAGQRTDVALNPIGSPVNWTIALDRDIVPEPEAVLVHGVTPQATVHGMSERVFCARFQEEVATPGTAMVGYNNFHFDDEVLRNTLWRNFHDPYEWAWKDGRSRWDALLVTKMFRDLRPEGIVWPTREDEPGTTRPDTRLTSLTLHNGIEHHQAHDALSDIRATIALMQLLRRCNTRLFEHAIQYRSKAAVLGATKTHLDYHTPFLLSGLTWAGARNTSVVMFIEPFDNQGEALVYDLTRDPRDIATLDETTMRERLFVSHTVLAEQGFESLPVQRIRNNRQIGITPLKVAERDPVLCGRLGIDLAVIPERIEQLRTAQAALARIRSAFAHRTWPHADDVEDQLYQSLIPFSDKRLCATVRTADPATLPATAAFTDGRWNELLIRYRARNAYASLSADEQAQWLHTHTAWSSMTPAWEERWQTAMASADTTGREQLQALHTWVSTPYLER